MNEGKQNEYLEILKEIELYEVRLCDLKRERKLLIKKMDVPPQANLCANYSGLPGSGMMVINLPEYWNRVQQIDKQIDICHDVLALKRQAKKSIEKIMSQMHTLEYRVAYMRDVEKKPLYKIAEELNFSESWIKKESQKIPSKRKKEKIPS